jgi:hypothetical protein
MPGLQDHISGKILKGGALSVTLDFLCAEKSAQGGAD